MLSVVISTYNPNIQRLNLTLSSLEAQSLEKSRWELIIIDNNSSSTFKDEIDISWHPNAKIVKEKQQGLTFARIRGFKTATKELILMVDDDNILDKYYIEKAVEIMDQNPILGAIGGKSLPIFEGKEPSYLKEFYGCLALRDLGEEEIIAEWHNCYPTCSPIGAGMAIRKTALKSYIKKIETGRNTISDRKGNSLSSGGDNDIILEILKNGFGVGYYPQLSLQHIIPKNRTTVQYLSQLNFESSSSWVKLLDSHNILPWRSIKKTSLPFRYFKSYLKNRAFLNKANYIKWKGACGIFYGLSEINKY